MAQLLLDARASVDQPSEVGCTPLYLACQEGHKKVAQLLLDAGASMDHPDEDGYTPLMLVAKNGQCEVAR